MNVRHYNHFLSKIFFMIKRTFLYDDTKCCPKFVMKYQLESLCFHSAINTVATNITNSQS